MFRPGRNVGRGMDRSPARGLCAQTASHSSRRGAAGWVYTRLVEALAFALLVQNMTEEMNRERHMHTSPCVHADAYAG